MHTSRPTGPQPTPIPQKHIIILFELEHTLYDKVKGTCTGHNSEDQLAVSWLGFRETLKKMLGSNFALHYGTTGNACLGRPEQISLYSKIQQLISPSLHSTDGVVENHLDFARNAVQAKYGVVIPNSQIFLIHTNVSLCKKLTTYGYQCITADKLCDHYYEETSLDSEKISQSQHELIKKIFIDICSRAKQEKAIFLSKAKTTTTEIPQTTPQELEEILKSFSLEDNGDDKKIMAYTQKPKSHAPEEKKGAKESKAQTTEASTSDFASASGRKSTFFGRSSVVQRDKIRTAKIKDKQSQTQSNKSADSHAKRKRESSPDATPDPMSQSASTFRS